jgi:hypothetical protein
MADHQVSEDTSVNGGAMSYRRVFILGGAALVLAACADVTAPGTQMRRGGAAAAARDSSKASTPTTTMESNSMESCRSGVFLASGRGDSVCADEGGQ